MEEEKACMVLYQAEGVKFAYIESHLFIDGHKYDMKDIEEIGRQICSSPRICPKKLISSLQVGSGEEHR